jgi:hypothetical protein
MRPSDLIHAMATRSMKKLRIAAILPGGIYTYLAAAGKVKMEDGGPEISNPILVGGNPNVGPAVYYDRVPVARSSELDTVRYEMTRMVGTYVISEQEVDENSGSSKLVDMAAAKMQALEIAIKKYQRQKAVGVNSGKDPLGIGNLLPGVVTSGTIGGINLATEPMFRPSVYNYEGNLDHTNIEETFDDILLDMNNDEGKISVIFAGRKIFNLHRKAARDNAEISLTPSGFGKKLAGLGLVGTNHQGIPIIYDEYLDPDVAYFVNENELMVHVLKTANMKMKDLQAPYDQDVIGKRYIMEYQLCAWKMFRTHAFIDNRSP